jgi:hypothetical protein
LRLRAFAIAFLVLAACGNTPSAPAAAPGAPNLTASPPPAEPTPTLAVPAAGCRLRGALPDPACTPGVADPAVTQDNLGTTICRSGYTSTVRPPVSYTERLKREGMLAYGFTDSIADHEEDHLIALELGGSPDDPRNLWPEPGRSPNAKDGVENQLHSLVCSGRVTLARAQAAIAADWTTAVAAAQN